MKRIVSFVMAAGMALSLAACGGAVSGASSTSTVAPLLPLQQLPTTARF